MLLPALILVALDEVLRARDQAGDAAGEAALAHVERVQLPPLGKVGVPDLPRVIDDACSFPVAEVAALDRLGRSMSELVALLDDLTARGVGLKVLTGKGAAIDTTRPEGRLFFGVFAAFAEFERELIRERTVAGIQASRRAGKRVGRPLSLDADKLALAQRLIAKGKGRAIVARMVGVGPATLRRALSDRPA